MPPRKTPVTKKVISRDSSEEEKTAIAETSVSSTPTSKDLLLLQLMEKLGPGIIQTADKVQSSRYLRWSTGVPTMDVEFHGGYPRGSYVSITGPKGCGKTSLAFAAIAEHQRTYKGKSLCAYTTLDGEIDRVLAAIHNVNIELSDIEKEAFYRLTGRHYTYDPDGGVLICDAPTVKGRSTRSNPTPFMEKVLQNVVDMVATGLFAIVVVDEIGGGESADAAAAKIDKTRRIGTAGVMYTRFGDKLSYVLKTTAEDSRPKETTVLGLCQVRAAISRDAGKWSYVSPEPHRLLHIAAVRINLDPKDTVKNDSTKEIIGKNVEWEVEKGRYGIVEGTKGMYLATKDHGIDVESEWASAFLTAGVVEQRGSWLFYKEGKYQGRATLQKAMNNDPLLRKDLEDTFRERIALTYTTEIAQQEKEEETIDESTTAETTDLVQEEALPETE